MRNAESVTFGGARLDRAAGIRSVAAEQERLWRDHASRVALFWSGKPLFSDETRQALAWLRCDHPIVANGDLPRVFLGMDGAAARFAAELADWHPQTGDPTTVAPFLDPSETFHPDLPKQWRFAELRGAMARLSPLDAEAAALGRALFEWHRTHRFCANCGQLGRSTCAGWQRFCPNCRRHHFPRTDPVVIMLVTRGNSLLLGRSPGWPEGMFSLLAGFVEPGETIEAAVRREVAEETAVRIGRVEYLASQPWPFPASLMIGCRAEALTAEITLDPVELEDARWCSREEMVAVMAGLHPCIKPARAGAIAHFLIANWIADRLV